MNAVIIDDEGLARLGIRQLLQKHPDIAVVAECANGKEAVEAIAKEHPDVVFLDIQMPEMDGFGVLQSLSPQNLPYIIFVTAFDQYALRAFEVHALDYLLKPVDDRRFEEALVRAKAAIGQRDSDKLYRQLQELISRLDRKEPLDRIAIRDNDRIRFIRNDEIDWIESQGNYVEIHAGKAVHLIREPISHLEEQLDPSRFVRIHRCTIVNVTKVRELQSFFHGAYRVILQDGTELMLSRRFREKARQLLPV